MLPDNGKPQGKKLNILVLHDQSSLHTKTTCDYLDSFSLFANHNVYYVHATNGAKVTVPLDHFDAVFIHYSVRLCYSWHIAPEFAAALKSYRGLKVLFIQDEYDNSWTVGDWVNKLDIRVIFTNVPPSHHRRIYPRVDHRKVEFFQALTGYVPLHLGCCPTPRPMAERSVAIGYRVRQLPFRYGKLAWEKFHIGQQMRAFCRERNLPHDIEWTDDKRIFGENWLEFLGSCRATLGAETGSNVFDFDGKLTPAVDAFLRENPGISFDDFFERFLKKHETEEIMNHISPRNFEAITMRTALILFEGRYCDVLQPNEHYIPLKKDFSNIDEVFRKLNDVPGLAAMTERAYNDIVRSGRYSYQQFVSYVMGVIETRVGPSTNTRLVSRVCLASYSSEQADRLDHANVFDRPVNACKWMPDQMPAGTCPNYQTAQTPPSWIKRGVKKSLRILTRSLGVVRTTVAQSSLSDPFRYLANSWAGQAVQRGAAFSWNHFLRPVVLDPTKYLCGLVLALLVFLARLPMKALRPVGRRLQRIHAARVAFGFVLKDTVTRRFLMRLTSSRHPFALLRDLGKVAILLRLKRRPADEVPFRIHAVYEDGQLQLVSMPRDWNDDSLPETEWTAAEDHLARGRRLHIVWDHSGVETCCSYYRGLFLKAGNLFVEPKTISSLDGLANLAQREPALVLGLLRRIVGQREMIPVPAMIEEAESDSAEVLLRKAA